MNNHILAQVHLVPTSDNGAVWIGRNTLNLYKQGEGEANFNDANPKHLYFTSDEEIKEEFPQIVLEKLTTGLWEPFQLDNVNDIDRDNQRRIIATTDTKLWLAIGITGTIPNNFIEFYVKEYNKGNKIEKLWLEQTTIALYNQRFYEYVENDCEVEIAINKEWFTFTDKLKLNSDGSVIWKIEEEKMYTREELVIIANDYGKECYREGFTGEIRTTIDEWINQKYPKS